MNRRQFTAGMLGAGIAAAVAPRSVGASIARHSSGVSGERLNADLRALAAFGANPAGGVSRTAYSDADVAGRQYVMGLMREAAIGVRVDAAGNIIGTRAGSSSRRPIVIGSHIDSVPDGGNYDGTVGSLAAIEIARSFNESRTVTRHPLEIVIWANEEGGLYGSRAASGQLRSAELQNRAWSGKTIAEGARILGGAPDRIEEARRQPGSIAAYIELHIEQGGTLERDAIAIGVVEGIVGIRQWNVEVTGMQNHSGTTPMDQRRDALLAAARFVEMVNRVVRASPGRQVGTVGRIEAVPGAPNVIPGLVRATLELRDLDAAVIGRLFAQIEREAAAIGVANGTTFAFTQRNDNVPAPSDPEVRAIIDAAAAGLGLSRRVMPSGAGHDAQSMAMLGPMGMIFIPSIGGISHSPKEFSTAADITNGARVLEAAVLAADRRP